MILTTFELDEYVFEAIRSGAAGFLVKDTDPDELVQAVQAVADGGALLSPGVTRRLIGEFASRAKPPQPAGVLGELTDRERVFEVLVGGDHAGRVELGGGNRGAQHLKPVQGGFGVDLVLLAGDGEAVIGGADLEVLAGLVRADHLADLHSDGPGAGELAAPNPTRARQAPPRPPDPDRTPKTQAGPLKPGPLPRAQLRSYFPVSP